MYYENLKKLKDIYHPECFFNTNEFDLTITFNESGELIGRFYCHKKYQGYTGRIHGGILSSLIDSAMTQFLFGHNIIAHTVRLHIKYSFPVLINKELVIKVNSKEKQNKFIYIVKAAIFQDNKKLVTANAKFWLQKDL